jgi:hypothetical protein
MLTPPGALAEVVELLPCEDELRAMASASDQQVLGTVRRVVLAFE